MRVCQAAVKASILARCVSQSTCGRCLGPIDEPRGGDYPRPKAYLGGGAIKADLARHNGTDALRHLVAGQQR